MKRNLAKTLKRSIPIVLSVLAAGGVVGTAVLAAKAKPKADEKLKKSREEKSEELSKLEVVKEVAPVYAPAAAVGAVTIFCIVGAQVLSRRQCVEMLGGYMVTAKNFTKYRDKIREIYGAETDKKIMDDIAVEKAKENWGGWASYYGYEMTGLDILASDNEKRLFFDTYSERYFEATLSRVIEAEYHLNRNFAHGGFVTPNEFYSFIGIEPIDGGDAVGWAMVDEFCWVDFDHRKITLDSGLECLSISFVFEPVSEEEYEY